MTDAPQQSPNASEPPTAARPTHPTRDRGLRVGALVASAVILAGVVWGAVTLFAPRSEAHPAPVSVAERESAGVASLAGLRRGALTAADGVRTATTALAGFSDPAVLADAATLLAPLDAALQGDDPQAIDDATALFAAVSPPLVERLVVDAEAKIAAAGLADPALRQAAWDASGAVRSASASGADFAGLLAPMRSTVEAAQASHAQAKAADDALRAASEWSPTNPTGRHSPGSTGGSADCDGLISYFCTAPPTVIALGAHIESCPAGTYEHPFWFKGVFDPTVTLDYPFPYLYRLDGHGLSVYHCDPAGVDFSVPHGAEPLPAPATPPPTAPPPVF